MNNMLVSEKAWGWKSNRPELYSWWYLWAPYPPLQNGYRLGEPYHPSGRTFLGIHKSVWEKQNNVIKAKSWGKNEQTKDTLLVYAFQIQ